MSFFARPIVAAVTTAAALGPSVAHAALPAPVQTVIDAVTLEDLAVAVAAIGVTMIAVRLVFAGIKIAFRAISSI